MRFEFILWILASSATSYQEEEVVKAWRKTELGSAGTFSLGLESEMTFWRGLEEWRLSVDRPLCVGVCPPEVIETDSVEVGFSSITLRLGYVFLEVAEKSFALEGYGLIGGADLELDGEVERTGFPSDPFEIRTQTSLVAGIGMRSRLYREGGLSILADFSLIAGRFDAEVEPVSNLFLSLGPGETADQDFRTSLIAWQISIYAAYRLEDVPIVPYLGIRFSGVSVEVDGHQDVYSGSTFVRRQSMNYQADQHLPISVAAGAEVEITRRLVFFGEVHVVGEFGISLGINLSF